MTYLISIFLLFSTLLCLFKRKDAFSCFASGAEEGFKIVLKMFKVLFAFTVLIELINSCGIIEVLIDACDYPFYNVLISMFIRPFSSTSCMALLLECFNDYGVDDLNSIVISLIYSCSDASVYLCILYFSYIGLNTKRVLKYSLFVNVLSYILILFFVIVFFILL